MQSLGRISGKVKLMVTARLLENQDYLTQGFLQREISANLLNLKGFINATIKGNLILEACRDDIQDTVTRKAQGIFLLARLHMDVLDEVLIESRVTDALEQLPETIDESYKNLMDCIKKMSGERGRYAYNIMAWVSHAVRPLTVEELQVAIASRDLLDETEVREEMLFNASKLSAYCCGLVVKDKVKSVRFVYYSARDYFICHREELFPDYHLITAFSYIKYILSMPLEHKSTAEDHTIAGGSPNRLSALDSSSENSDVKSEDSIPEVCRNP
ncbi:hypothetical protein F5883DRAFT_100347 [Diaporthe sp. PMI_573]|nr:hypothetical protein F5883DRAFT_100347 [Diaporthaceae sp. PMI_573]